jgi:hypothetical protein
MTKIETKPTVQIPTPDPALNRLERLIGTWEIRGRTLAPPEYAIHGRVVIDWLPGGFFMVQRGEIAMDHLKVESREVVGYDRLTKDFSSLVYSNLDPVPQPYRWDVKGDIVTHWTPEWKYTGSFNADATVLSGGWRPTRGAAGPERPAYDTVMLRVGL